MGKPHLIVCILGEVIVVDLDFGTDFPEGFCYGVLSETAIQKEHITV
jgi:hypothetical protein